MENLVTELVCTRLSHDIIGNIGAVSNAVELLEEGDLDFMDDIKSILKTSAQTLSARLKFFRMVFGLNNANLEDASLVEKTAKDYLTTIGSKDFPFALSFRVPSCEKRKIALLMVMIMADVLVRGGRLDVFEDGSKIVAQIDAGAKISRDKIEKIKALIQGSSPAADAGLAPLFALIDWRESSRVFLDETPQTISLIAE